MSLGEPEDFTRLEEVGMRAAGVFLALLVAWKAATFLLDRLTA